MCPGGTPSGALGDGPQRDRAGALSARRTSWLLSQYPYMTDGSLGTAAQQQEAKKDGKLVNFLRGQRGNEDFESNSLTKLFRHREPSSATSSIRSRSTSASRSRTTRSTGYAAFKATNAAHADGLRRCQRRHAARVLRHRRSRSTLNHGQEAWAVIPSTVLPNLYKLADDNYKRDGHQFYVDGTPVAGDLVEAAPRLADDPRRRPERRRQGLLRARRDDPGRDADAAVGVQAGRGVVPGCRRLRRMPSGIYVRLQPRPDVRQADHHEARRQLGRHRHLGLQQRQRRRRRRRRVTSTCWTPLTGELKQKITDRRPASALGDAATPSGLAQINNYVDNVDIDNTTLRAYGGDVLGNIWRFDFVAGTATRLGDGQGRGEQRPADHHPARARRARRQAVRHGRHRQAARRRPTSPTRRCSRCTACKDPLDGRQPDLSPTRCALVPADGGEQVAAPAGAVAHDHLHGLGRRLRPPGRLGARPSRGRRARQRRDEAVARRPRLHQQRSRGGAVQHRRPQLVQPDRLPDRRGDPGRRRARSSCPIRSTSASTFCELPPPPAWRQPEADRGTSPERRRAASSRI